MTPLQMIVAGAIAATLCADAVAQFVKGNEAVRVIPDGTKKVETPPTTGALLSAPCPAARPGCGGGGWVMVETAEGLLECTEFYARRTTCRESTYGAQKLSRRWIVKKSGEWLQCQFPDLGSKCVSIKALPYGAVQ
jgi:flavoprotein